MRWTNSLRLRLIVATSLATSLIVAACGVFVYFGMRKGIRKEFDTALMASTHAIAGMTETKGDRVVIEHDGEMPQFVRARRPDYFQLWDADGRTIHKSRSLGAKDLAFELPPTDTEPFAFARLPDGGSGRVMRLEFEPQVERPDDSHSAGARRVVLVYARHTRQMDENVEQVGDRLMTFCVVTAVIAAVVMGVVITNGLRPVGALAGQIARLEVTRPDEQVKLDDAPEELLPIAHRVNELLARCASAFGRERAFSADVAHELRTPLAGIKTAIEVCRSQSRGPDEYRRVLDRCLIATERMHGMVESLLMIGRVESGELAVRCERFDLVPFLDDCWQSFAAGAAERGLKVDLNFGAESEVITDPELLRSILHNLFDNAVTYADDGGRVLINAAASVTGVRVEVANTGCTISKADVGKVFERFWRGDASRNATGLRCGLGLPLSRRLARALGGDLGAEVEEGGVFRIILDLPRGSAAAETSQKQSPSSRPSAAERGGA